MDAVLHEVVDHAGRAALGEVLVVGPGAPVVGVAFHPDVGQLGVLGQDAHHLVEQRERLGLDDRLVGVEVDAAVEADPVRLQGDQRTLHRAAIVLRRPGLVGALVFRIGNAVHVPIRAAVQLARPRLAGAAVVDVGDAVLVPVEIRAPVRSIPRLVGAAVLVVGDAVAVPVVDHGPWARARRRCGRGPGAGTPHGRSRRWPPRPVPCPARHQGAC